MSSEDVKVNPISSEADNRGEPGKKSRAEEIKIVIDAISNLLEKNKLLFFLIFLLFTKVLTEANIVNFFSALKWFKITLWFWG